MTERTEENGGVEVTENAGTMTATVDRAAVEAAKAAEAETELLAGKFKTPDDLVKAYKELEKKLGAPKTETPAGDEEKPKEAEGDPEDKPKENEGEDDLEAVYGKAVATALTEAGVDVKAVQAEFEKDGKFSDATVEAFEKVGYPRAMVEAYQRGLQSMNQTAEQQAEAQAEADLKAVVEAVGGDDGVKKLQDYIRSSYSKADVEAYNAAMATGDVSKAKAALMDAKARYDAEFGSEKDPVRGKGDQGVLGYKDDNEMMADMRKPAYKKDPAFRAQVEARVAASKYHVIK